MKRVVGLLIAVVLLVATSGCGPIGSGKMKISALLSDSAGLFVGNDVGILGVPVGKVTSITPEGQNVKVTMSVNSDQAIPANAGAVVVARSVATDRYVELTPVYHSGPKMVAGTVINEAKTRTPVDFDQVLASLNDFATGIAGSKSTREAIKRTLAAQSKALSGQGPVINKTIHALSDAVNGISGQRGNITSTLTSLDTLTTTLSTNQQTVRQFLQQVARASQILAADRNNFRSALQGLSQAVQVVSQFANANRDQIVKTMNSTTDVAKQVLSRRSQLTEILDVFPVTLQNLSKVYKNGRVQVRLQPTDLLPLGGLPDQVCNALESLHLPLCDVVGLDPVNGLKELLASILGLGGKK